MSTIHFFTDGACRGNPGVGSWAVYCSNPFLEKSGVETMTTNNRMELMAVIQSFEWMETFKSYIIYTDSQYVWKGIKEWRHGWKKNGWKNSKKKVVENIDLWKTLDALVETHPHVDYKWIRGHNGNEGNEYVDRLANEAIDKMTSL